MYNQIIDSAMVVLSEEKCIKSKKIRIFAQSFKRKKGKESAFARYSSMVNLDNSLMCSRNKVKWCIPLWCHCMFHNTQTVEHSIKTLFYYTRSPDLTIGNRLQWMAPLTCMLNSILRA